MSMESLAAFRTNSTADLHKLAEEHIQHDLTENDRTLLKSAASRVQTHALVGSFIGLALGGYLAIRLRQNRQNMYRAFRAREKPTHVRFADGREEPIPDITPMLKPTTLGDIATYTFFAGGGLFFGGELGLLSGSAAGRRSIAGDPESRKRIEDAFRGFRVDVLKKEVERLQGGSKDPLELI